MNVLEKILEEINKERRNFESGHTWSFNKGLEYAGIIIRSHMDEVAGTNISINSELIDRENLKEEIESLRMTITGMRSTAQELEEYKKSILRIIDEQPTVHANDNWIPVSERLPEDGTYLCTLDGELCGIDEPFTGMCGIENGKWDEEGCVIAWRPLPKPYKGGE